MREIDISCEQDVPAKRNNTDRDSSKYKFKTVEKSCLVIQMQNKKEFQTQRRAQTGSVRPVGVSLQVFRVTLVYTHLVLTCLHTRMARFSDSQLCSHSMTSNIPVMICAYLLLLASNPVCLRVPIITDARTPRRAFPIRGYQDLTENNLLLGDGTRRLAIFVL